MLAVDTNVLVRFLINDNLQQSGVAKRLLETTDLFVASTVFLEAESVLRRIYGLKVPEIAASFRMLAGLPHIVVEEPATLAEAIDWMESGVDFADALHLTKAHRSEAFVTFDRKLAETAKHLAEPEVRILK